MPRSYSLFLIAILAGGGWFFIKGPGQGNLGKILSAYSQSRSRQSQSPFGFTPPYQGPSSGTQIPAQYASQAAPAPAPPSPMFGGPAIRIASFNIEIFGDKKASKTHVMWTLAAIIQNFHVVAIQEIRTQDDYFLDNFLRNYVNQNGRAYDKVIGPRLGRSSSKEQYAFLYDTAAIEVNPRMIYTLNDPDDLLHREPLVAMFRVRGPPPQQAFTFVLINIHTDPDETDTELDALGQVYQVVRRTAGGEDDIILLGDLNVDDQHLGQLGRLEGIRPLVRGVYTNTLQTALYDNIVLHQLSTAEFSGRGGVFNFEQHFKLTRDQALQVSDHLPIWAEFSAYESAAPGRVATREAATIRAQ
ncbi:MAG: endonuclease/exonuclease/phosphatase family protein [Pirellulales bacterium]